MKQISIVTPCYNEETNVKPLYQCVKKIFDNLKGYTFEHIFIDNCSTDRTPEILREMAKEDYNVKVILNNRNFGHIRSPYYGLLQTQGDAAIAMDCDFQEPPELIPQFIQKWSEGHKVVVGVKTTSNEASLMFTVRKFYYRMVNRLADIELIDNFTGFGIFDASVIDIMRKIPDPYPYFRGLVTEIGGDIATIPFNQPQRKSGITKNNFYTLYDIAMLGITNHSKVPLRLATICGFIFSGISLFVGIAYIIAKIIFWNYFSVGMAPFVVGMIFFTSVQLFFIGILGEYIGSIHTQVLKRPLVIEKERINFDQKQSSD